MRIRFKYEGIEFRASIDETDDWVQFEPSDNLTENKLERALELVPRLRDAWMFYIDKTRQDAKSAWNTQNKLIEWLCGATDGLDIEFDDKEGLVY